MSGIILAGFLVAFSVLALAFALIASKRVEQPKDAHQTREVPVGDFVTRDEMDAAIAKNSEQLEFEWNEWYEKFKNLHLRLSKRDKRKAVDQELPEIDEDAPRPSVLAFRRTGSV